MTDECNISRREFLGQTAVLSAAITFVKLDAKAEAAAKKGLHAEDYVFSSAVDVAQAIRRGDISSLELTELMFRRIDSINPKITPLSVWTELMENTTFFCLS
ncbi:MAG: hypothetical protein ONB45_24705 [candidate division KSB1 bacterium]|nr:hypothetical protein [candidate division KSB1 bacterium]